MDTIKILTPREIQIIELIDKSLTNLQMANTLSISIRTVETHRKNILKKTGCHNALALVKWANANKMLQVAAIR